MEFLGYLLYPTMAVILLWMWLRVRGMSIEEIVQQSARHHHELTALFEIYPQGGDWQKFQHWTEDSPKPE